MEIGDRDNQHGMEVQGVGSTLAPRADYGAILKAMAKRKTPLDPGETIKATDTPSVKPKRNRQSKNKFAAADSSFNPVSHGPKKGRPVKYDDQRHSIIAQLAIEKGGSMVDVARLCAVDIDTVYAWANEHQRFSEATAGMADPNIPELEHELARKARKHTLSETTYEPLTLKEQKEYTDQGLEPPKSKVTRVVVREQDGDNWAMGTYLANRARHRWSTKPRDANNGEAVKPMQINWLNADDLDAEKNDNIVVTQFEPIPEQIEAPNDGT